MQKPVSIKQRSPTRMLRFELPPGKDFTTHQNSASVTCAAVVLAVGKTIFDRQVAALDVTRLTESLAECSENDFL